MTKEIYSQFLVDSPFFRNAHKCTESLTFPLYTPFYSLVFVEKYLHPFYPVMHPSIHSFISLMFTLSPTLWFLPFSTHIPAPIYSSLYQFILLSCSTHQFLSSCSLFLPFCQFRVHGNQKNQALQGLMGIGRV